MTANRALSDTINYAQAYQIRTQNGHDAAIHHYRQLLLQNPQDTSAATRIAASKDSLRLLAKVGWPYAQLNEYQTIKQTEDWEGDIEKLHNLLDLSNYHHSSLRSHIFNLPTGIDNDDEGNGDQQSLAKYKNDYPMGPTYIRPLAAGQGLDLSKLIDPSLTSGKSMDTARKWLPSLQCLATLFLLSSCVPKQLLIESIVGGKETLELLLRLGIVFIFDAKQGVDERKQSAPGDRVEEDEWVVPLIHLFPLDIPPIRSLSCDGKHRAKHMVLMTDLHPNVLGMTSIPKLIESNKGHSPSDDNEEGAVMYIGPDSLALVHHLHASMLQYVESQTEMQSFGRILDVCTGSGVQALATLGMLDLLKQNVLDSAGMDPMAIAVDINERALRFTRFNAHLNGYSDKLLTVHADLLSGEAYPRTNAQHAKHEEFKGDDTSLVEVLLNKLVIEEKQQSFQHDRKKEQKFDIFLANPPFIPVPPSRSDDAASSLRKNEGCGDTSTPRYGLFSSGGASGEDCLRAIVQIAPSLLRSDGGLFAVVSEFMNPPPLPSVSKKIVDEEDAKEGLASKIDKWWGLQLAVDSDAKGILFTNEFAINCGIYAQRRAMKNDQEDINVWKEHLDLSGIHSVSPGLLFVQTRKFKSKQSGKRLNLKHQFVPKTDHGSIWTPHNFDAVEFTRNILMDLFR